MALLGALLRPAGGVPAPAAAAAVVTASSAAAAAPAADFFCGMGRRSFVSLACHRGRRFLPPALDMSSSSSSSNAACKLHRCSSVESHLLQKPWSFPLLPFEQQQRLSPSTSRLTCCSPAAAEARAIPLVCGAAVLRPGQQQMSEFKQHPGLVAKYAVAASALLAAASFPLTATAAAAATASRAAKDASLAGALQQRAESWATSDAPLHAHETAGAVASSLQQHPPWGLSWLLPPFWRRRPAAAAAKRQHVVVLGTGWASVNFFRFLDPGLYDITIISPRNYFTFTPLLPSVCAGTLSPLACIEPVRALIQEGGRQGSAEFYEAHCTDVDFANRFVCCESGLGGRFKLQYDYLVIAVGSEVNTFGVKDVAKHAFFLREVEHAMLIRKQVMNNFEQAALPQTSESERRRLLHFVVVGGGPTGVESAAEFADFIKEDMSRCFPQLMPFVSMTLIEGGCRLLPTYSPDISAFAARVLADRLHVKLLLRSVVTHVDAKTLQFVTSDAEGKQTRELSHGFVLWASGVGQVPLVKKLLQQYEGGVEKKVEEGSEGPSKQQKKKKPVYRALPVDAQLRLLGQPRVYALGDCAFLTPPRLQDDALQLYSLSGASEPCVRWLENQVSQLQNVYPQLCPLKFNFSQFKRQEDTPLSFEQFKELLGRIDKAYQPPAPTAQNARQEGLYLAAIFNSLPEPSEKNAAPAFKETWNGSLAYVGDGQAVAQLPRIHILGGVLSLPLWKAVYMQMQITWRSRMICLFDWLKTFFAGRDVGRDHQYYRNSI